MASGQLPDIKTAVELYYSKTELTTADIMKLFGLRSSTTAIKLKKIAREEMVKTDTLTFKAVNVDTECAFRAWGLDIAKLERRLEKLHKFQQKYG